MRLIFLLLLLTRLYADAFTPYLESSDKAEVYAQELLDAEKSEEALAFIEQAREKYSNNAKIMVFGGDAAVGMDDLDLAKQYYQAAINLSSEEELEAIIQDHIEGGYIKEASILLDDAKGVYPKNAVLLVFSGRTAYEMGDLTSARNNYLLALELDPNNEIAAANINQIESQAEATENKVVTGVLQYLGDKGLDFLMIFLAFLGGELLAKKQVVCESRNIVNTVNRYLNKKYGKTYTSQYKGYDRPFCLFVTLLNFMTVAGAIMVVWLFLTMTTELFSSLLYIDLTVMTEDDLLSFSGISFLLILLAVLFSSFLMSFLKGFRDVDEQFFNAVELLQNSALEGQFTVLREACSLITTSKYAEAETACVLDQCYSAEAKEIITKAFDDLNKKKEKDEA